MRYALMTGLLTVAYAGLVLLATQMFRFHTPVAVAASTLTAAVLFNLPRSPAAGGEPAVPPPGMTRPDCSVRGAAERRQPTWTRYEMTWPVSCTSPPTLR
jgi:hypothetical protein